GGKGNNTADFSQLVDGAYITFEANPSYRALHYFGVTGKGADYFYNFSNIIGSKGNDIFYGHSGSNAYTFDGHIGDNKLTYERSSGGVTYNIIDERIYKVNNLATTDFKPHVGTADTFKSIKTLTLSNLDDVVVASSKVSIGGSSGLQINLGG